jgi:hypothetical protein
MADTGNNHARGVCGIFQHHSEAAVEHGHTELCELLKKKE